MSANIRFSKLTCCVVNNGLIDRANAKTPETCGVDIDVPEAEPYGGFEVDKTVEYTSTPGAKMSTLSVFEKKRKEKKR